MSRSPTVWKLGGSICTQVYAATTAFQICMFCAQILVQKTEIASRSGPGTFPWRGWDGGQEGGLKLAFTKQTKY